MDRGTFIDQRSHVGGDVVYLWKTLLDHLIGVLRPNMDDTKATVRTTMAAVRQINRSCWDDSAGKLRFRHVAKTRCSVCWMINELPLTQ